MQLGESPEAKVKDQQGQRGREIEALSKFSCLLKQTYYPVNAYLLLAILWM